MMLHWELRGKGRPLVFLHGWGTDSRVWQRQVAYFSQDYSTLTLDLPGHGKSAWGERKDFLSYTKEYIISLCEKYNLAEPILIGWSFGCLLLFKLVEDSSFKIGSLVLVAGTPKFVTTDGFPLGFNLKNIRFLRKQINHNLKQAMQDFYNSFFTPLEKATGEVDGGKNIDADGGLMSPSAETVRERNSLTGFTTLDSEHLTRFAPLDSKHLTGFAEPFPQKEALLSALDTLKRSDFRKALPRIDIPTLIICGENDPLIPQEISLYMHKIIKSSSLVIMEEAGHAPFLTKPVEFNQRLQRWINQR